jgi:glutathione S-transferase
MMLHYTNVMSGNCYKVRLLLARLGFEYERRELSVFDRSNRPEVLGDLNPAQRVPTLVLDDGRVLAESGAILWYLADGTEYLPTDGLKRAQVLQWMFRGRVRARALPGGSLLAESGGGASRPHRDHRLTASSCGWVSALARIAART